MTNEEQQRAKAICAEATPPPWFLNECNLHVCAEDAENTDESFDVFSGGNFPRGEAFGAEDQYLANRRFAAEARELLPRAVKEIERLQAHVARWERAIEGLTPSGSEFVNDPERCAAHIRERTNWPSIALRWKERAERAEAEVTQLQDKLAAIIRLEPGERDIVDTTEEAMEIAKAMAQRCAEMLEARAEKALPNAARELGETAQEIRREFKLDAAPENPAP